MKAALRAAFLFLLTSGNHAAMANILFIGLGNMGYPMAGHLAEAGHQVTVFNRTVGRSELWISEFSGQKLTEFSQLPTQLDAVFLCVGRDEDVQNILIGEQKLLSKLPQHCLIVDHTTTSASLSQSIGRHCASLGLRFADAPVSGGQQGAVNGQLTIMCGASATVFEQVKQLTAPYTRAIEHMGEIGSGQKAKMVNQICVAGLIQGLAEGVHFAQQSGLDVPQVMKLLSQGAAGSWQMSNRYQTMLDGSYDHGFAVNWMHKDLEICLSEASQMGISLPVTEQVDRYYQELQSMGAGEFDTSALLYRLQKSMTGSAE